MKYAVYLFLCLLSGCQLGPKYEQPHTSLEKSWEAPSEGAFSYQEPCSDWWELFHEPLLTQYISQAATYNNDILKAVSSILQARALRQIAASSFFPQLSANINAIKTYFSKNGPAFTFDTGENTPGLPFGLQVPQIQNLYNVLFDASWEIDFFGKTKKMVEAADAMIGSAVEAKNDTLITVIAEIARSYIELRSLQEKTELIRHKVILLEEKATLIKQQYQKGYVNALDYEHILADVANEKANLPDLEAKIYQNIYALSVLIGEQPQSLVEELKVYRPLPSLPKTVAIGLKSDLLRRRPDVRQAERLLAAATAHVGVAIAQFFPTFTLLGDGGLQSLALKNLFSWGSKTWDYGGGLTLPIFQGGKLKGNLEAKKADMAAAGYHYQQTVLKALEEAESFLQAYTQGLKSMEDIYQKRVHYDHIVSLSEKREQAGLTNSIMLIDSQLQLDQVKQMLIDKETYSLINIISLYKVLGGGWEYDFLQR